MSGKVYKIKFITSKNCFCFFSAQNIRKYPLQSCVKVTAENDNVLYFSVGPDVFELEDDELGISSLYAASINIKENTLVEISLLNNVPIVKSVTLSAQTLEDYEILALLSENVQNTLLDHVTIVNKNQNIMIWVSSFLHVRATIDDVQPAYPGRLQTFTEVIIKTPTKNDNNPSDFNTDVIGTSLDSCDLEFVPKVFRIHPVEDLIRYFEEISSLGQYFDIFVSRDDLPLNLKRKMGHIFVTLKIILPPLITPQGSIDESLRLETIGARLLIIEDYFKKSINHNKSCNFTIFYCHELIFKHFNLRVGAKVILCNVLREVSPVDSIIILTSTSNVNEVEEKLKEFLAKICEKDTIFLNADIPFPLADKNMYCALKFTPSSKSYCLMNSESLRNVKYSVVEKELPIEQEEEESFGEKEESDFCSNLGGFQKIYESVTNILVKTLESDLCFQQLEGIILSGNPGCGKTGFLKFLKEKISDFPLRFHCEMVDCNTLKGKTIDSLNRVLFVNIMKAIYFQPSVLLLDDFHVLCGKVEGEVQTQESVLSNRTSESLRDLLNTYVPHNQIQIIATCEDISDINNCFIPARGKRVFCHFFKIDDLNQNDRIDMLKFLFSKHATLDDAVDLEKYSSQMDGFVIQDFVDFASKVIFESIKESEDSSESLTISSRHVDAVIKKFTPLSLQNVTFHIPGEKDFSDVGGLDSVKNVLIETVLWPLQYPKLFDSAPLRIQTGVLLYGPPGTGKTLIAKAAAKECNIRLIAVKGPELLSKYIGASEQGVRNIFEKAQSAKPCILFFDEFDSLAPRRGHDSTGVTDRVVNQLLTQLDGVESLKGVCVLAATSRPDLLDPALLRPGRLNNQIFCSFPDFETRIEILKALSKSTNFSSDVDLTEIASMTDNYSGADLQGVLSTAHLDAVNEAMHSDEELNEDPIISQKHLKDAVIKTKPSLSNKEKAKYDKIYQKFQGTSNVFDSEGTVQKVSLA